MVNGNDLLEYEESHIDELYEGFVMEYAEEYKGFIKNKKYCERLEEKFTIYMGDIWTNYVLDELNNSQSAMADMYEEEAL